VSELEAAIRPDHGYTQNCRAVQFLYTVLSELNNDEQADFLRFTTGSPHLPVGGLKVRYYKYKHYVCLRTFSSYFHTIAVILRIVQVKYCKKYK